MARSLAAEFDKLKRARPVVWTFASILVFGAISFGIAPQLRKDGSAALVEAGGVWRQAVDAGIYDDTWKAALHQLPMSMASGLALLLFAFVAAYLFGHEFKEGTMVSTLTAPIRREYTVVSKMVVLAAWIAGLTVFLFVVHVAVLLLLGGPTDFAWSLLLGGFADSLLVALMLYLTMPVFAWLTVWGAGYLRPMLGAVVLLGMGNGLVGTDVSKYYPINMPLHIYGTSWMPISPSNLVPASWLVLVGVFVFGLAGTAWHMNHADVGK